jgi:hypothetical protein
MDRVLAGSLTAITVRSHHSCGQFKSISIMAISSSPSFSTRIPFLWRDVLELVAEDLLKWQRDTFHSWPTFLFRRQAVLRETVDTLEPASFGVGGVVKRVLPLALRPFAEEH